MGHSVGPKFAATSSQSFEAKPVKKPAFTAAPVKGQQASAAAKPKDNGSWGPLFKNKENFKSMHMY